MIKKLAITAAAFMAFAVLPATAFAVNDGLLTQPTGTTLAPTHGSPIPLVATHSETGFISTDASGNTLLSCDTATMKINLETNASTGFEGTITSFDIRNHSETHCNSSFGNFTRKTEDTTHNGINGGVPWCIRSTMTMQTDEFQIRGNSCTSESRPITIVADVTTIGPCTFQRTNPIPGTYTTHPSATTLSLSKVEFKKVTGSFLCPATLFFDVTLRLYRETAGSHVEDPVYIENP